MRVRCALGRESMAHPDQNESRVGSARFPQPHAWPFAVLIDEDDAGRFEGGLDV